MNFLTPLSALIAAGIMIPALVALYFLKLRRQAMVVSSTLLWKKAIQDMQVNAPFQRLRKNLLLLLQLLILIALLFALARPTIHATAHPGQRVVILLDHSASMNATDGSPTRLDEAKRAALALIDQLAADGAGQIMVVSFAQHARVVQPFTGDLTRLRHAVRSVEPTDQASEIMPAFQLIEPFALKTQAGQGNTLTVHVISDGRVNLSSEEGLALRDASLRFIRIGSGSDLASAADNVGVVSLSARRDYEKPQVVQVFARLANFGPQAVKTHVTLSLDGQVLRVESSDLPDATDDGPGAQSLQFDFVWPDTAQIDLRHDHADALSADDRASLILAPARRLRVLLVTQGNAFLERVLRSVGVRELTVMDPEKYENQNPESLARGGWNTQGVIGATGEGFDVILFDAYSPREVPRVDGLYLGAVPPIEGLAILPARQSDSQTQVILDWVRDDPLMRYVVLDDVILGQPGRLTVPLDGVVLATGQAGPIMAKLTRHGVSHVVSSFDVLASNWPLYVSFPVFVDNAVRTLGMGSLAEASGVGYLTGQVAVVPLDSEGDAPRYDGPAVMDGRVSQGQAVLPAFTQVGVYASGTEMDPPFDRLAVNLLNATESNLRPADQLEVGTVKVEGQTRTASIRQEAWPWFAWAALAVLMVEWLFYTRRMHL